MEREVFIVLNVSTNEIEIKDFGLLLPSDVSIDLADFDESFLSNELDQYLQDGDLVRLINGVSVGYENAFNLNVPLEIDSSIAMLTEISKKTKNPTGFVNYGEDSSLYVDGNTVYLIPDNSVLEVYLAGKNIEIEESSINVLNIEGFQYVYLDSSGNLNITTSHSIFDDYDIITVSSLYWNNDDQEISWYSDQRHGVNMSLDTRHYLEHVFGLQYISGNLLYDFSTNEIDQGSDDAEAQFSISNGIYHNEDLHVFIDNSTFTLQSLECQIAYLEGSNFRFSSKREFPVINASTGRLAYNKFDPSQGYIQEEVTNDWFVNSHIIVMNDPEKPIAAVQGINQYERVRDAREGAIIELKTLLNSTEDVNNEWKALATVIYQTSNDFINTPKAIVAETDINTYWLDWRTTQLLRASEDDHGRLTGLSFDTHKQYALLDGRSGDILKISNLDSVGEIEEEIGVSGNRIKFLGSPVDSSDATTKYYVDSYNSVQDISIGKLDASVNYLFSQIGGTVTKSYVDGSLAKRDTSIQWLVNNTYTKNYIDGSLAERDTSINYLFNNTYSQTYIDGSLNVKADISYVDGSLAERDSSIIYLFNNTYSKIYIDASLEQRLRESSLGPQFYWDDGSLYVTDVSGAVYSGGTNITIDSSNTINLDSSLNSIQSISFDTSALINGASIGTLYYNVDVKALAIKTIGGQEFVPEEGVAVYVYNNNIYDIPKGRAIYVSGGNNNKPEVSLSNGASNFATVSGLAVTDISSGEFGWMQTFGIARQLDTTLYEPGDILRLSPEPSGFLQDTTPSAPDTIIVIGTVIKKDATEGEIFLTITESQRLSLLPDVNARLTQTNNQVLAWDGTNFYWNNVDVSTLGYEEGLALQSLVDASNAVQDGRLLLLESSVNVLWQLPQIYAELVYVDGSLAARDASIEKIFNTAIFESSLGGTLYWNGGELDVSTSFVNDVSSIGNGKDFDSGIGDNLLTLKSLDASNGLIILDDGSTLLVDSSIYVPDTYTYTGTSYSGNLNFHIPFLYFNTKLVGERITKVTAFESASGVTQISPYDVSAELLANYYPWGTSSWDPSGNSSILTLTDWIIFYQVIAENVKSSWVLDVSNLSNGPYAVYSDYNAGSPILVTENFIDREPYPERAYLGHIGVVGGKIKVWHEAPDLFGTPPAKRSSDSYGIKSEEREGIDLYILDASKLGMTGGHYYLEGASFRDIDFYNDIFLGEPNANYISAQAPTMILEIDPSLGFTDSTIPPRENLLTYSNRYYDTGSGTYVDSSLLGKFVLSSAYIVDDGRFLISRGGLYDSISEATADIANFNSKSPQLNTIVTKLHPLLAYIVMQTDISTLEDPTQFVLLKTGISSVGGGTGGGGAVAGAQNIGLGTGIFKQLVSSLLQFKSISTLGSDIVISEDSNTIYIDASLKDYDPSINNLYSEIQTLELNIDASFVSEREYVNSTFIPEVSFGPTFFWDGSLLDVSIAADVTKAYVDGSLAQRDASIIFVYNNGLGFLQESSLNYGTFFFDSSSLLDISVGKYDTIKFLAGKSTTQALSTTYSDVTNWDVEIINNSTLLEDYYAWDNTNGIITFGESGWYEITVQMNTDVLSGATRANTAFKLQENTGSGYIDIPYSETWMYNRTVGQGADNGSFTTIRQYSDGDTFKVQALEDAGDNQITSAQISIIKSELGRSLTIYDVSGGVSISYVDGSLLARDASIEQIFGDYFGNTTEFLYESSLGAGFVFNEVTDVYDVSITGAVGLYAWARTTDAGGVIDTYGLSVSRTGTGVYQYTFNSPLTNANYGIIGQPFGTIQDTNCQVANVTNTGFELTFGSGDNGTAPDVPVDAEHSVMVLGPPTEVGLGVSKDYVDGSLAERDVSIESIFNNSIGFVKESSLGTQFSFDTSGFIQVDVSGGSGDVTQVYVDGSLALRDASIQSLFEENGIQDSSISFLDSSVIQLFNNKADLVYVDGSLAIRDASIEVNTLAIQNLDSSLNLFVLKSGDIITGSLGVNEDISIGGSLYIGNDSSIGMNLPYAQIDVSNGNKVVTKGNYYGQEYQLEESLGVSSTTSTSPVTKVTLNTTDLPFGTYKITVAWIWNRDSASNSGIFDVALNGTPQGTTSTMQIEIKDTTDAIPLVRIFYLSLSGINTIEFRYWGETGFSTTTVSDATVELIRVS